MLYLSINKLHSSYDWWWQSNLVKLHHFNSSMYLHGSDLCLSCLNWQSVHRSNNSPYFLIKNWYCKVLFPIAIVVVFIFCSHILFKTFYFNDVIKAIRVLELFLLYLNLTNHYELLIVYLFYNIPIYSVTC